MENDTEMQSKHFFVVQWSVICMNLYTMIFWPFNTDSECQV